MARPAGFEPATHGLDVPELPELTTSYPITTALTRPIFEKHAKLCVSRFVPTHSAISSSN